MKKFLIVAALVAVTAMPANAASMKEKVDAAEAGPVLCTFLPLLPKCVEYWKGKREEAKMEMESMMAK